MEESVRAQPTGQTPPAQEKAALRRRLKERLAALDPATRRQASARMMEAVLDLPEVLGARRLLSCLSFGDEPDTWQLVDVLHQRGVEVYVPRAASALETGRRLHVHLYPCDLRTLSFGLRQPLPGTAELAPEAIDHTLDAALVLGLAFDHRGYRLGYGAGYFDRFLAGRPFPAIGLAFDQQLVEHLPAEAHDVPMKVVVTDRRVLRPTSTPAATG